MNEMSAKNAVTPPPVISERVRRDSSHALLKHSPACSTLQHTKHAILCTGGASSWLIPVLTNTRPDISPSPLFSTKTKGQRPNPVSAGSTRGVVHACTNRVACPGEENIRTNSERNFTCVPCFSIACACPWFYTTPSFRNSP